MHCILFFAKSFKEDIPEELLGTNHIESTFPKFNSSERVFLAGIY
jgi:hypothetical protein